MRELTDEQAEALGRGFVSMMVYMISKDEGNPAADEIVAIGNGLMLNDDPNEGRSFANLGRMVLPYLVSALEHVMVMNILAEGGEDV